MKKIALPLLLALGSGLSMAQEVGRVISSTPVISQPNALSTGGQTVVTEQANIQISQDKGSLITLDTAPQLADVVRALNSLGATPQDLLAILQAIKASGAMNAELEVI